MTHRYALAFAIVLAVVLVFVAFVYEARAYSGTYSLDGIGEGSITDVYTDSVLVTSCGDDSCMVIFSATTCSDLMSQAYGVVDSAFAGVSVYDQVGSPYHDGGDHVVALAMADAGFGDLSTCYDDVVFHDVPIPTETPTPSPSAIPISTLTSDGSMVAIYASVLAFLFTFMGIIILIRGR